jgi:hypothetical protein
MAAVALLACGLFVWLTHPRHQINKVGFESIREGMTEQQVEAALGGPAGDYTGGRCSPCYPPLGPLVPGEVLMKLLELPSGARVHRSKWVGEEAAVEVFFGPDGRVWGKWLLEVRQEEDTFLGVVRRLLLRR